MLNISPETGEPEVSGEIKSMIDRSRQSAGVHTFDQAVHLCRKGKHKDKVIVMNNPKDGGVIWVYSEKSKQSYWMSKAHLDKR